VVEIQFDVNEGHGRPFRRSQTSKTAADLDEAYVFLASPTLGQVRFGDEDGPFGGLMNAGFITNFGTGGVYGDWQDFVIRPNRTTTSPGDMGDNSKIIYLSPQFFGFDFGASFAFNEGSGGDTGCLSSLAGPTCDRAYAAQGVTTFGRGNESLPGRRNELQAMARWRGNVGPVGLAVSGGTMLAQAVRDITVAAPGADAARSGGVPGRRCRRPPSASRSAAPTCGATRTSSTSRAARRRPDGAVVRRRSYTAGPFTIGANAFSGHYAGSNGFSFNTTTGAYTQNANNSVNRQRRYAYSVAPTTAWRPASTWWPSTCAT
jgi:hypothetical protein